MSARLWILVYSATTAERNVALRGATEFSGKRPIIRISALVTDSRLTSQVGVMWDYQPLANSFTILSNYFKPAFPCYELRIHDQVDSSRFIKVSIKP